jgi:hypothetical protein
MTKKVDEAKEEVKEVRFSDEDFLDNFRQLCKDTAKSGPTELMLYYLGKEMLEKLENIQCNTLNNISIKAGSKKETIKCPEE